MSFWIRPNARLNPRPGGYQAVQLGCRCPVIDNARGLGFCRDERGRPLFVYSSDCPLHGARLR